MLYAHNCRYLSILRLKRESLRYAEKVTIILFSNILYAEYSQKTPQKRGWDINQLEMRKSAFNDLRP